MRFYNIFFSPTGGTEKVADIVAKGTKLDAEEIDLIKEPDKLMKVKFEKKDLCLVAVPSYGGRIPSVVTDMFRKVKANGTKAILVAVFGNRMIDDGSGGRKRIGYDIEKEKREAIEAGRRALNSLQTAKENLNSIF